MQYAGKATKTVDEDFERLSAQFKELVARAEANEKALRLHYNAVIATMNAVQGISSAAEKLLAETSSSGLEIFARAATAINGEEMGDPPVRTSSARTQLETLYEEKVWGPVKSYRMDLEMLSSKRCVCFV